MKNSPSLSLNDLKNNDMILKWWVLKYLNFLSGFTSKMEDLNFTISLRSCVIEEKTISKSNITVSFRQLVESSHIC